MKPLFLLLFIVLAFNAEAVPRGVDGGSDPGMLPPTGSVTLLESRIGAGLPHPWSERSADDMRMAGTTSPPSTLLTGMVSYWTLDESTGNAIDVGGGGNNGTPTGVTQGVSGKVNTAYSFDGSSSKVDMGNPANLDLSSSGSMNCWVYVTSDSHDGVIAGTDNWSSDLNGYGLYIGSSGTLTYELANSTSSQYLDMPVKPTLNAWHMITLTWDGITIHSYLDGANQTSQSQTINPLNGTNHFVLGYNYVTNGHFFSGSIDEVGVWNKALTPAEVSTLYNSGSGNQYPFDNSTPVANAGADQTLPVGTTSATLTGSGSDVGGTITGYGWTQVAGGSATITSPSSATTTVTGLTAGAYTFELTVTDDNNKTAKDSVNITVSAPSTLLTGMVSYWTLDESTGNAIDVGGGGNNGTPTGVTQGVSGKVNTAYSFDGSSSKVDMGNPANLELSSSGSMNCWVYVTSDSHDGVIAGTDNFSSDLNGYGLIFGSDGTVTYELANATSQQYGSMQVQPTLNAWHMLTLTWDGITIHSYIDGANQTSLSQTINPLNGTNHFVLGYNYVTNGHFFSGSIDEVGVWNKALTPAEVSTLYNSGSGNQYPFDNSTPVANAGADQTLPVGTTSATLTGSGSDVGGTITGYGWTQVAGGSATITSPSSATTTVTGLTAGAYTFELTVTDDNNKTAKDSVNITVSAPSTLLTGMVSYWTLDESTGNAIDVGGGGNNGTPTGVTQGVSGKVNTAYSFDGSSSKVDMGNPANLELSSSGSMNCWVYVTSDSHDGVIAGTDNFSSDLNGYGLIFGSDGTVTYELADSTSQQYGSMQVQPTLNAWHMLTLTWDGITIHSYIDGANQTSLSQTINPLNGTNHFVLGYNYVTNGHFFSGSIDEVGVWNKALTPAEVSTLYNSGSGNQYPFDNSTPVANAGADQTLPVGTTSATLTGSGSDVGGTITGYGWTQVAGGSATITSPSSATTTVTGLTAGAYTFELTVTDDNNKTAKDSVNITIGGPSTLLTGMVSYWTLDESTGNAIDVGGGGNNGTPTGVTQGVSGKVNTAYSFDGSSSKVDMGNPANLELSSSGSMNCWVYVTSDSHDGVIAGTDNFSSDLNGYGLIFGSDGTVTYELADSTSQQYGSMQVQPTLNAWHMLTLTWDGITIHSYIDGANQTSLSQTINPLNGTNHFVLGYNYVTNGHFFSGSIDEVGVWNKALTPAEVSTLYNSGSGNQYPFGGGGNIPPVANAGPDQHLPADSTSTTLTGSGTDADGTITGYLWTETSGGSATISSPSSAITSVTGLSAGSYTFQLTVTDNKGATDTSSVHVKVDSAGVPPSSTPITWKVAPNPVSIDVGFVVIISSEETSSEQGSLVIWDANGKELFRQNNYINPGQTLVSVNTSKMPAGGYIIALFDKDNKRIGKPKTVILR